MKLRTRYSAKEWEAWVTTWRESGEDCANWCRLRHLSHQRFEYWRRRLEKCARPDLTHKTQPSTYKEKHVFSKPTSPAPMLSQAFVELVDEPESLRLECGGVVIGIRTGFDPDLLRSVVRVLREV